MTGTSSSDPATGDRDGGARVHLLMEAGDDRRLLADWLGPEYDLTAKATEGSLDDPFDLCIVDAPTFRRHAEALRGCKRLADPVFLPVLLIAGSPDRTDPSVWSYVDDVVGTPIRKAELRARLSNLVERRMTSLRLEEREEELERTVSELRLKERAMDAAPSGVTITDPDRPDNPTIYANAAFERITGYRPEEVIGRNMRFLQGPATDEEAVEALREGIDGQERVSVTLLNYRKDGTRFWNRVEVAPVYDESGDLINYVGFQTDVTDEKIREQRLSVLNRLMRHNLSNDLNVIEGYADILLDALEDPEQVDALRRIKSSAGKLAKVGENASRIERILSRCRAFEKPIDVGRSLARVCEQIEGEHPDVDLSVEVEGGPWHVTGNGLEEAFAELVGNAIRHNGADEPAVAVSVEPGDEATDRVDVRIVDNGPGVPPGMVEVLREGEETQLQHGDGLGLWLVYWIVTLAGGGIEITPHDAGGTEVVVTLPAGGNGS